MRSENARRDIDIALRCRKRDEHVLEVLDPTGHITLRWRPDDPASIDRAREEFEKLKAAGFAFFVDEASAVPVTRLKREQHTWLGRFICLLAGLALIGLGLSINEIVAGTGDQGARVLVVKAAEVGILQEREETDRSYVVGWGVPSYDKYERDAWCFSGAQQARLSRNNYFFQSMRGQPRDRYIRPIGGESPFISAVRHVRDYRDNPADDKGEGGYNNDPPFGPSYPPRWLGGVILWSAVGWWSCGWLCLYRSVQSGRRWPLGLGLVLLVFTAFACHIGYEIAYPCLAC